MRYIPLNDLQSGTAPRPAAGEDQGTSEASAISRKVPQTIDPVASEPTSASYVTGPKDGSWKLQGQEFVAEKPSEGPQDNATALKDSSRGCELPCYSSVALNVETNQLKRRSKKQLLTGNSYSPSYPSPLRIQSLAGEALTHSYNPCVSLVLFIFFISPPDRVPNGKIADEWHYATNLGQSWYLKFIVPMCNSLTHSRKLVLDPYRSCPGAATMAHRSSHLLSIQGTSNSLWKGVLPPRMKPRRIYHMYIPLLFPLILLWGR